MDPKTWKFSYYANFQFRKLKIHISQLWTRRREGWHLMFGRVVTRLRGYEVQRWHCAGDPRCAAVPNNITTMEWGLFSILAAVAITGDCCTRLQHHHQWTLRCQCQGSYRWGHCSDCNGEMVIQTRPTPSVQPPHAAATPVQGQWTFPKLLLLKFFQNCWIQFDFRTYWIAGHPSHKLTCIL